MQQDPMRPAITLGDAEHRRLLILAMNGLGHTADDSDYLHYELDRASLLPDLALPADVVRVGSTVTYRSDDGLVRTVTVVYPAQLDVPAGRISVLSPVGAALIGLRPGQAITRMGWDGDFCRFTVLSVKPPATRQ
jgi:regulator of nucleoside diphosphate kinase